MLRSEKLGELTKALVKAQIAFPSIPKNKTAGMGKYSYRYADLPSILETVTPILGANGLAVVQLPGDMTNQTVSIKTMLLHSSGEFIEQTFQMPITDTKPQSIGSALTYGRRYALTAMLNICADEDDDAQIAQQGSKKTSPPTYGETYEGSPTDKKRLAELLQKEGITDKAVMSAFSHKFIGQRWDSFTEAHKSFVGAH